MIPETRISYSPLLGRAEWQEDWTRFLPIWGHIRLLSALETLLR